MNIHPINDNSRAALLVSYYPPTNTRGARYKVTTQRGSAFFPERSDLDRSANANFAAASMLARFVAEDRAKYGAEAMGWGDLSSYYLGHLPDGDSVFVTTK